MVRVREAQPPLVESDRATGGLRRTRVINVTPRAPGSPMTSQSSGWSSGSDRTSGETIPTTSGASRSGDSPGSTSSLSGGSGGSGSVRGSGRASGSEASGGRSDHGRGFGGIRARPGTSTGSKRSDQLPGPSNAAGQLSVAEQQRARSSRTRKRAQADIHYSGHDQPDSKRRIFDSAHPESR